MSLKTKKLALVLLIFTLVAPLKFLPKMVKTGSPVGPVETEKLVITGALFAAMVKLLGLVPVPPCVTTWIGPVIANDGTEAMIVVSEITLKLALGWSWPLKTTAVTPIKFEPEIVTTLPIGPLTGENPLTTGAGGMGMLIV
jgi:hypothetical protein